MSAEAVAARFAGMEEIPDPWPHGILDGFLPGPVFADLSDWLPEVKDHYKSQRLPASVLDVLRTDVVCETIRKRFGFTGCYPHVDAVYRTRGVKAHADRADKPWSGVLYIAGDPKGTELYDAAGKKAKEVEFVPNRLLCWSHREEMHAIPNSAGRWVLQWWFLPTKPLVI